MHRVALIMLYDVHRKILLQHRTEDAPFYPGYWAFFGGACEQDETPREAVIRETEEELCYQLNDPQLVLEKPFKVGELDCMMFLFVESYLGDKNKLSLCEGQGWGWFSEDEMSVLLMSDRDRMAFKVAYNYIFEKNL